MTDNVQQDKRLTLRVSQSDLDLLEEVSQGLQRRIQRSAKEYGGYVRVTQKMTVMEGLRALQARLKELERER